MGADRPSDRVTTGDKAWSDRVAGLAADALVDAGIVDRADFERAAAILSEEVSARLCLGDFPPVSEAGSPPADA